MRQKLLAARIVSAWALNDMDQQVQNLLDALAAVGLPAHVEAGLRLGERLVMVASTVAIDVVTPGSAWSHRLFRRRQGWRPSQALVDACCQAAHALGWQVRPVL